VKKDVKSKVVAMQEMAVHGGRLLLVKILITTIHAWYRILVKCGEGSTNLPELNFFAINNLPSQPFPNCHLDFTSFSQWPSWPGAAHFF